MAHVETKVTAQKTLPVTKKASELVFTGRAV